MKILYLNGVCWNWIMQRPQILALKLDKDFDCTVLSKKFILGKKFKTHNPLPKNNSSVFLFPKENNFSLIRKINALIYRLYMLRVFFYDCVWICHPSLFSFIPKNYKGKIIYDCMDDHCAMSSKNNSKYIQEIEQALLIRADLVFVTSSYLKNKLNLKNGILVRNGFQQYSELPTLKISERKQKYVFGYFGTISLWFDFDLLKESTIQFPNIFYKLIGPLEKNIDNDEQVKVNKNVIFTGAVPHKSLQSSIEECDVLIMPFKINDIILSVDPVKLYEYISMGKCIISIKYAEIERFEPFVYFYENSSDYLELIKSLEKKGFPPKYTELERKEFLDANSWEVRYQQIKKSISNYI